MPETRSMTSKMAKEFETLTVEITKLIRANRTVEGKRINPVAKPARQFGHMLCKFFCVYRPYKESISKEMNNDNDLNLHSMTKLSGCLRY